MFRVEVEFEDIRNTYAYFQRCLNHTRRMVISRIPERTHWSSSRFLVFHTLTVLVCVSWRT